MGILLAAMTIGGLLVGSVMLVISIATATTWLRNFVLGGAAVWFLFYFAVLVGFSVTSDEKHLALNEPKEFCGFYFDCHMHTAVTSVRTTKTIGNKIAAGEFYIVKVKVFSNAKAATLGLKGVDAHVVDATGETYDRNSDAESELAPQPDFEIGISPDESFEKEIVFDIPAGVREPRLDIREGLGADHALELLLVGDEDSLLHKRAYFDLSGTVVLSGR